ncbi:MAG: SHOCT domain-containing protein, partial [Alphaproteobacteria bacterium]
MDETKIDKLEKLARLKASGALSDAEFDAAKAAVLRDPVAQATFAEPALTASPTRRTSSDDALSTVWQKRFAFMDAHG